LPLSCPLALEQLKAACLLLLPLPLLPRHCLLMLPLLPLPTCIIYYLLCELDA
jgi:hypothetical protein